MQPLSGSGTQSTPERPPDPKETHLNDDSPLSPAQRTALEKLVVRIMAISPAKAPELWAALRHDLALNTEVPLMARHFDAAEQHLLARLTQAQDSYANRQLVQQLSDLLPQGNNRQAVSDFIRQQFALTSLNQLSHGQLQQVLTLLKSGELTIPQPQQHSQADRPILPAELQTLQQQITKLSAATGKLPTEIKVEMNNLLGPHSAGPLSVCYFQVLNQYLHARYALSQQVTPNLHSLYGVLKQPASAEEQQQLTQYSQQHFAAQADSTLSQPQLTQLLDLLIRQRISHITPLTSSQIPANPVRKPRHWKRSIALFLLVLVLLLAWRLFSQ